MTEHRVYYIIFYRKKVIIIEAKSSSSNVNNVNSHKFQTMAQLISKLEDWMGITFSIKGYAIIYTEGFLRPRREELIDGIICTKAGKPILGPRKRPIFGYDSNRLKNL